MKKERVEEIIKQVLHNPQVRFPPISYKITDVGAGYSSEYIDVEDFKHYLEHLEHQLISRLSDPTTT